MQSIEPPPRPVDDDRTTRARIRDVAIAAFGERGVDGTSLKVIAEAAGVSQALIVHHFGSKQGLRSTCDAHVAALITEQKRETIQQGPDLDVLGSLRRYGPEGRAALRYLARTAGDGAPAVTALIDDLFARSVELLAEGERSGLVRPSDQPEQRAAVLLLWSLGALTLHEHAQRLLGTDLSGEPEQLGPYVVPAAELLSHGVLTEDTYARVRGAFDRTDGAS